MICSWLYNYVASYILGTVWSYISLRSRKSVKTNSVWHGILEITVEIRFTELHAEPWEGH